MGRKIPIADTGYTIVYAEWVPEPSQEAQALARLSVALDDWEIPMTEARAIARESIRRRFETETDPYGNDWPALNDDYLEEKRMAGYPDNILVRTGDLERAAPDGVFVTDREIMFDPTVLPFYGEYHQSGLPERANPLPQRMFVGIDEEAENEIEEYFVYWINRVTDLVYKDAPKFRPHLPGISTVFTSTGLAGTFSGIAAFGGGTMVRGAGGRFIGKTFSTGAFD